MGRNHGTPWETIFQCTLWSVFPSNNCFKRRDWAELQLIANDQLLTEAIASCRSEKGIKALCHRALKHSYATVWTCWETSSSEYPLQQFAAMGTTLAGVARDGWAEKLSVLVQGWRHSFKKTRSFQLQLQGDSLRVMWSHSFCFISPKRELDFRISTWLLKSSLLALSPFIQRHSLALLCSLFNKEES